MTGRPVLQSSFEYHVWKTLDSRAFPKGGPMALCNEVTAHDGTVNSAVLVMLMDELASAGLADREVLKGVVSKSRATDCMPSVHASGILLEKGDPDGAEYILEMSAGSQEVVERSLAGARIRLARGDREGADQLAGCAYGYDSSCRGAYAILAETDPEGGWPQRANIQDILEGGRPSNPHGAGRVQDLYAIYYDWFTGRRDAATEALVRNQCYRERDPEFLLASARMSVDEKDWHSASMVYSELLGMDAPPFVYVEAAEAALGGGEPARALELLSKADGHRKRVQRDVVRARLLMGDRAEMLDAMRALLDNESSGSDEYVNAVRFLVDRGMEREAEAILDRYSRFSGDDADTLTMRSVMLMRSGDYITANRMASRAVRADKMNPAARAQLARMLYLMDKPDAAERECTAILSQDPHNADALGLMRDLHMSQGDYAKAAGACRQLLEGDPRDVSAMLALALCTGMTGDTDGASELFRRVMRADGSRERSVAVVSSMITCGMNRDAESACATLERQYPRDPMLKRLRGNAEYALGDYLKASVAFADAASLDPNNPVLWHSKGMADEARGDLESAEDAYNRAVLLDQGEPEYWISKAAVQERSRDRYGAVESLNRAIELDPASVQALVRKAALLASASRPSDALYFLRQASAVRPDDVRMMDMEASLMVSAGDPEGAAGVLRGRLSIEPSPDASLRMARLLLSCGDREGAVAVLDRALDADPGVPLLAEERERMASGEIGPREEPEPAPEPEPEEPAPAKEDPEALAAMASSLLAAGDLKGAMRMADRALTAEPDDPDLYCLKARVALASGDADGAAFLAGNALRTKPGHPGLHEVTALAREAKGDLRGALTEIDASIACGNDTAPANALKGRILEAMGHPERAASSYGKAVALDPEDLDSAEAMARQQLASGNASGANGTVSRILRKSPGRASAIMLKADICVRRGDDQGLLEAAAMLSQCREVSDDQRVRMVRTLEDGGHIDEARSLMGGGQPSQGFDNSVKRYAEKALRRAYTTRTSADDPDILDALGLDPGMAAEVSRYIAERPEYGIIKPGDPDFPFMERQSHDVVVKLKWTRLEDEPLLPLEKVFVAGGYRDADSAKAVIGYIRRAMLAPMPSDPDPRLGELSMSLPKGMSVYEVMRQCDLGVYEARVVQSLIVRRR